MIDKTPLTLCSSSLQTVFIPKTVGYTFNPHRDFADVTSGQWNLTSSRTVSALSGYSQASDSAQDRPGRSAPLSGPGCRSPSRRCCPPRPLCPPRPGLLRRLLRCSSTACTAGWERGRGRGQGTVTRGTRRCWRRRWRLWYGASLNTLRATAEVTGIMLCYCGDKWC